MMPVPHRYVMLNERIGKFCSGRSKLEDFRKTRDEGCSQAIWWSQENNNALAQAT
jgi:hypothetical protein